MEIKDPKLRAAAEAMHSAGSRLHHLSMMYVGSMAELGREKQVMFLGKDEPGLKQMRDLIDLVLICRAEINGLSKLMIESGVVSNAKLCEEFAEQYDWLAQEKAKLYNCKITDAGLVFGKE